MAELTACPLCRSALPPGVESCPDCGGDLSPYRAIQKRASDYIDLARELISRNELSQAQVICEGLPLLSDDVETDVLSLQTRLLIAQDKLEEARERAKKLPEGSESTQIAKLLTQRSEARLAGRELYNAALSAARAGNLQLASQELSKATTQQPFNPTIWVLRLKVNLKLGNFEQCYKCLAMLDSLSARPPEYTHLEQLLPPVSQAV